jgi:hypothetical protein
MGLKQQLLDSVSSHVPTFDPTKHSFTIEFDGGGDSFDSFSFFDTDAPDWNGDNDTSFLDDNLLLDIIEQSGVNYMFVSGTTVGNIKYKDGTLTIYSSYQADEDYDEEDPELGWEEDTKQFED